MAQISVRVIPNASRAQVVGWQPDGSLKLKVPAPPEGGRANEAVIELLAAALDISRRQISIISGQTSRQKRVQVDGAAGMLEVKLPRP